MPISLGPPTTNVKLWSKPILIVHWIFQFITLGIFQLMTIFIVFAIIGGKTHHVLPWLFTGTMVFILIANALILCTILYEWSYTINLAQLSANRYLKIQIVKSLYFFLLVIMTFASGSGLPMEKNVAGAAWVWATIWRLAIFVGPFWSSLVYAIVVKRKAPKEFGEEGELAL